MYCQIAADALTRKHQEVEGTGLSQSGRCRKPFGALRRPSRSLAANKRKIQMSHHASGPNFDFPRGDARLDMTDLYAFTKPDDPNKSILILNVHPSFRLDSPEPTTSEPFKPGALYEFKVDTNGDAVADFGCSVQFSSS